MITTSPRLLPIKSGTSPSVGPNYYITETSDVTKENFVPFLSNTKRGNILKTFYTEAIYDSAVKHNIVGGSSIRNKAPRVTFGAEVVYNRAEKQHTYKTLIQHGSSIPCRSSATCRRPRKLYMCKVPFYSAVKGPSVPSKIDDNGYTVDNEDNLVKNLPDEVDDTLGPAYYNTVQEDTMKKLYGGCRWSSRTAPRRTIEPLNDYPGPGSYDLAWKRDDPYAEATARTREMAAAVAYLPRTLDAVQAKSIREGLPGPQDYNLVKPLVPRTVNKHCGFNVSSKRFKTSDDNFPGPGEYETIRTLIKKKVSYAEAGIGENILNKTLNKDTLASLVPGPAKYEISRFPSKPKYLKYTCAPFETSAPRILIDIKDLPGPADYSTIPVDQPAPPSAIFRRPLYQPRPKEPTADCATYNVMDDYNRLKNRKEYSKKEVGFLSKTKRVCFKTKEGPCFYEPTVFPKKGFYFSTRRRFDMLDNGVPGPNSYMIQPIHTSAMYKTTETFNIRMKENVIGSKLLSPRATRAAWMEERQKRKILRVFHRPKYNYRQK